MMNAAEMAPSDNRTATSDDVVVQLLARDARPDFVVPLRRFMLTRATPTVSIGRASKQESKGFVASIENGWFDSPVMSRYHAELSADFDSKTLLIEDTASLHGTYRRTEATREDRLPAGEKVPLRDGDIVRFGTDIYRGQLTFPPCTVHVKLSWNDEASRAAEASRATPTNTFTVPDYTDEEDLISDDDDYTPEEKLPDLENQLPMPNPVDPAPNSASLPRRQPSNEAMPSSTIMNRLHSDVIDLTSEPESLDSLFLRDESHGTVEHPAAFTYESDESELPHAGGYSSGEEEIPSDDEKLLATSEEQAADSTPYSPQYESDSDANWPVGGIAAAPSRHSDGGSVADLEHTDIDTEFSADNDDTSDHHSVSEDSDHADSTSDEGDENNHEDEVDIQNGPDREEDTSSASDEADPFETSMFDNESSPAIVIAASSPPNTSVDLWSGARPPVSPLHHPLFTHADCGREQTAPFIPVRPTISSVNYSGYPSVYPPGTRNNREPSPSDAVMMKANPNGATPTANLSPSSTTRVLGERYGKYEFFSARDHNRASVMNNPLIPAANIEAYANNAPDDAGIRDTATIQSSSSMGPTYHHPTWKEPDLVKDAMSTILLETHRESDQPTLMKSAWTPGGEAFLHEPNNYSVPLSDERTRLQSPELDMTSAATFVESKKNPDGDAGQSRRRLTVKFLLSQESKEVSPAPPQTPRVRKRRFDEISSGEEPYQDAHSLRNPISAPDSAHQVLSNVSIDLPVMELKNLRDTSDQGQSASTEATGAQLPAVVVCSGSPQTFDNRSVKRRRFSKFAKYASVSLVSGVTSAALLFAGLAATAPQIV